VQNWKRHAAANAKARGERPGTFDFLGFTHHLSKARDGKRFRMKRVTSRKKFRAKLVAFKEWLKEARVLPLRLIMQKASQKLRGHYGYYGVTDNYRGISRFYRQVSKLLYKWLNRRSQRRSYRWAELVELLKRFEVPKPRVQVDLYYRARRTV
jgi:RNA-directed DNA polymerase